MSDAQQNKPPEGFTEFAQSLDSEANPQEAIASRGFGQLLSSGPAISKAPMEGIEPESDPLTDLAGGAIASKLGAGAAGILDNEIGAVGKNVKKLSPNVKYINDSDAKNGLIEVIHPKSSETNAAGQILGSDYDWFLNQGQSDVEHKLPFNNVAALENISVHPDLRGQKIGHSLYKEFENEAKKQGVDGIVLNASPMGVGNESRDPNKLDALVRFYKSLGFQEYGPKEEQNQMMIKSISSKRVPTKSGKLSYAAGGTVAAPAGFAEFASDNNISTPDRQLASDVNPQFPPKPAGFDDFVAPELRKEKYGSLGEMGKTALEGAGQGLVGPLAPLAERALGVDPEDIKAREAANPGSHLAGEIAGLVAPALVSGGTSLAAQAAKLTQTAGLEAISKKLGLVAGDTLASKIGIGAAKSAIDNMLISGSDEASKMVLGSPEEAAQTALTSQGLSDLLGRVTSAGEIGAVAGGALGLASKLVAGSKIGQFIADFKGRINQHLETPDPVKAVGDELSDLYHGIKEVPVFGSEGIKQQAIEKAMPQMNDKISSQVGDITDKLESSLNGKLRSDPHAPLLEQAVNKYKAAVQTDNPSDIFTATQELKKQLQEWGKYNKDISPLAERPFRDTARTLATTVRESLEDTKVWQDAAKIQQRINSSFSDFLPTLKDIEKTFTTKIEGEPAIDPGKINTYINQLGKPNAEIKMQKVANFLKQSEKYKDAINEAYASIGADSPFKPSSLNALHGTLEQKTLGARVADAFIAKGLTKAGGEGLAAAFGAGAGTLVGHPAIGAVVSGHALGPFFSSVLPGITKALIGSENSASGFKAAVDYAGHVSKGEGLLSKGVNALFKAGSEVLPSALHPTAAQRLALDDKLKKLQKNMDPLLSSNNALNHYLPDNDNAQTEAKSRALAYIGSMRPNDQPISPLDSKPVPSAVEQAKYDNVLNIAQQPLVVLNKVKDGTINTNDLMALNAMYPALAQRLQGKLTASMIDHVNKGMVIPYKTRLGLSLFLAHPMDSTMLPSSIMAAQPKARGQQQQQGSLGQQPRQTVGVPSSPALQKLPNMYQTAGQSREIRQQRQK